MTQLKNRIIKFQIEGSNGFYLDELGHTSKSQADNDLKANPHLRGKLSIDVEIEKNAQVVNSTASIRIGGLTIEQLSPLTSEFSRFNYDYNRKHPMIQEWTAKINIQAGYDELVQPIFSGEVTIAELRKGPPNLSLQITAISHYFARSQFNFVQLNPTLTFETLVRKVGEFLGMKEVICKTDYNQQLINNAGIGQATGNQLLVELNLMFPPYVTAWVDNDTLYVMQLDKYRIDQEPPIPINNFVDIPQYTERGALFEVLYDSRLSVGKQICLQSDLNPYPFNGQTFVIYLCRYNLSTRNSRFNIQCQAQL